MFTGDYQFLTTKPARRLMSALHPEELKVLPLADNDPLALNAKVTYLDATTAVIAIDSFTARAGEVYTFQIGIDDVAYDPDELGIRKIEIYCGVYDTAEEILTYYPVTIKGDEIIAIYYTNSYGGIDSLFCNGEATMTQENSGITTKRGMSLIKGGNTRQYATVGTRARYGKVVHTGYSSKAELLALQDLFLINHAWQYLLVGGEPRFVPIDVDSKVEWPSNRENLQALPIRFMYSNDMKTKLR